MPASTHSTTFQGNQLTLLGSELKVGQSLPEFRLTANDMSDLTSDAFRGKVLLVSCVPSLDTPVCSIETKKFNTEIGAASDKISVLTVSMDLPFAQKRWCGAEGVESVVTASAYKYREFGEAFGVAIKEWALLARAVFVFDREGKVVHSQYVPDVSSEPDYEAALGAAKKAAA